MLYLLRHGKTDWNAVHRLQGCTDVPLNEEGRKMAALAGERYRDVPIDICYSSPLGRARETAEIFLRDRKVPILCDDRLREMSFGIYEGEENPMRIPGGPMNILFHHPERYRPAEGGESFEELFARTEEFLNDVARPALAKDQNLLVVAHGGTIASMLCQVRKIPLEKFWECLMGNCQLVRLL